MHLTLLSFFVARVFRSPTKGKGNDTRRENFAQNRNKLLLINEEKFVSVPNGEVLGREVQYGSAVQLDGLL